MKRAIGKLKSSALLRRVLLVWSLSLFLLLCQFFVEWVRLQNLRTAAVYFACHLPAALLATVFLALLSAGFAAATRRLWPGALFCGGFLFGFAYVNFYKLTYRGDPLLPKDLAITGDAAKVATELSIPPTFQMGVFFLFLSLSLLLLWPVRVYAPAGGKKLLARVLAPVLCAALALGRLAGVLRKSGVQQRLSIDTLAFRPQDSYTQGTFATAFLMYAGAMTPKAPAGYGRQAAEAAAQALPASDHSTQDRPDVIVVMLESYYRLDNVTGATYDTNLTENYDKYAAQGIAGRYLSDKYSGGTEEMEFGALTGFSTSMLPTGSIPYVEYVRGSFPCYPRFLREQGYKTIALHPYDPTIYSREKAYPAMGFDEFYSEKDFVDPERHGTYIDDCTTAKKLIELYEQATADGSSVFIHTVTMQNHIPNAPDEYADDYKVHAQLDSVPEYFQKSLDSVATGLRDADRAIGLLCDYFSKSDRDVVILFFGDHQTAIGDQKGRELLDELPSYTSLDADAQEKTTHWVPYLMWSNYEQKNAETAGVLPPYMLLATMLSRYNVVRPAWFDFLCQSQSTLRGVQLGEVLEPDGSFGGPVKNASAGQQSLLATEKMLQYDAMFGGGYAHSRMYG